ncbi:MAG: hypothetical protein QOF16_384 [Actinomycetota bacterium]|jgi:hypothetical protein|nr:hypothetical protein [Actinomycetota bacterium]MEA2486730.1 hypothetical protein [Actinomycetota bacterium]
MDHVIIRKLEHVTAKQTTPHLSYAIETRERPGPAHKNGAFGGDEVWLQLRGGLVVAKAAVELCWVGEYSDIREVRARTRGTPLFEVTPFWAGRARYGYAAVAKLASERWVEPFWAGPRTYGYEWVVLENESKRSAWLTPKDPPRTTDDLRARFADWKAAL